MSQERPVAVAPRRPGPRPGQRRGYPVRVMVIPVEADHRRQPRGQRRFRQPGRRGHRRIQQHYSRRGALPQPGDEPRQRGHVRPGPVTTVQLQVPPPQLQRLGITADRVRRRAGDPVILQELLYRPHLPVVNTQHRPGPVPVRQLNWPHADAHPPPVADVAYEGKITSRQRPAFSAELGGLERLVRVVAVLSDGRVACGGSDGRLLVWDPSRVRIAVDELGSHSGMVTAVAMWPGGKLISAGEDGWLLFWDPTRPSEIGSDTGQTRALLAQAGASGRVGG